MSHFSIIIKSPTDHYSLIRSIRDAFGLSIYDAKRCFVDKEYPLKIIDGVTSECADVCAATFKRHGIIVDIIPSTSNDVMIAFNISPKVMNYPGSFLLKMFRR